MKLGALSPAELTRQLACGSLRLRTGPFVTAVQSRLPELVRGLGALYASHDLEPESSFTDFVISVDRPDGLRHWIRPQVLFRFDGVAPFAPLPVNQGFALFEWGMNWCIYGNCHQYVTLHAAVLERGGRALVLPAPSGSGKSTLCAGLAFNGWRLLSDELTVIDPQRQLILPVPRPISLKNASIDVIREFVQGAILSDVVRDTTKGSVAHCKPDAEAVLRAGEPARPGWIVVPKYREGADAKLERMPKARAMMMAVDSTFNFNIHRRAGFELLSYMVSRSECYEFTYGRLEDAVAVFDALAGTAELPDA
ncbi:HprK-related kinase A [Aquabacterium sp.]|uniref:HprK-related kinase A n=1 Tax=Aquabacterium sp. TaxID=1872578 RepID=UPI002C728061|nr:HprK-related kinase A [Aquabacterium sp.]HSW06822.1 HprK-related kinase A [Aquabacterium sp.]